jgi:DNA-binding GntR family transcriptional regulator
MSELLPDARLGGQLSRDSGLQSVVDQVTEAILAMILDGKLPPGNQVAIRDLSEGLGVSHVPVREALRRLESRGLVIFHRGRRPQIAPADVGDFDAIYDLRRTLEVAVASKSLTPMTSAQLSDLQRLMADFRASVQREGSLLASPTVHRQLHLALLPAASPWDAHVLNQLWDATERYLQLFLTHERRQPEVIDRIIAVHQALVDVAASGDMTLLMERIRNHVDTSIDVVRPVIQEITEGASASAT